MNECVFIYRTHHISFHGGLQFLLSEIECQLVNPKQAFHDNAIQCMHPSHFKGLKMPGDKLFIEGILRVHVLQLANSHIKFFRTANRFHFVLKTETALLALLEELLLSQLIF